MSAPDLGERLTDFYARQIAFYESLLEETQGAAGALEGEALEEAVGRQNQRTKQMRALEQEYELLKRDWDAEGLPGEEAEARVAALAQQADELAKALLEANRAASGLIEERMAAIKESWAEARKGRETLKRYRAGDPGKGGYLDREA